MDAPGGLFVPPVFRIVQTDAAEMSAGSRAAANGGLSLWLAPGAGFGTGHHETTQLCLQAIYALRPRGGAWRLLDFGSGSGILAIAAAQLGARVDAVEVDAAALAHAERNARLNGVNERVASHRTLAETQGSFELIVANILLSVLLEFRAELCVRLAPRGTLVLSGLVSTDVPPASAGFAPYLGGQRPQIFERGAWRALVWSRG